MSYTQKKSLTCILILEPDEGIRECLESIIRSETSYYAFSLADETTVIQAVHTFKPDLLILHTDFFSVAEQFHCVAGVEHVPTLFFTTLPFAATPLSYPYTCIEIPFELD